jgi:hypothetical protein
MSNVVPLAKFKLEDHVIYQELTMDGDVCLGRTGVITKVIERVFTTEMGWLYFLMGRHGYFKEDLLKTYREEDTPPKGSENYSHGSDGFIADVIDPSDMTVPKYAVGSYASCLFDDDQGEVTELLLIIGVMWEEEEFVYDCAMLDDKGNFVTTQTGYSEEELDPLSPQEMAGIRNKIVRPPPRLTLAFSK